VIPAERLSVSRLMHMLSRTCCVVSVRLHGTIAGLVAGAPVVPVAYDPKVRPTLEAAGFEGPILEMGEFPESLAEALDLATSGHGGSSRASKDAR